jgi:hypothetical protein
MDTNISEEHTASIFRAEVNNTSPHSVTTHKTNSNMIERILEKAFSRF